MTDATPLAPEQDFHRLFVAAARDFHNAGPDKFKPGYEEYGDLLDAVEALSATPAPSDQDAWELRATIDQITHDALPLAGVAMDIQGRARVQVYIADAVAKLVRDQDASQAQGEVRPCDMHTAFSKWCGHCLELNGFRGPEDAPGATAQDGVERLRAALESNVPVGQIDARVRSVIIENVMAAVATPTPTIPAGMVAGESVLTALRNLRRAIEETGAKHSTPALKEAFDQATIVLGRGY